MTRGDDGEGNQIAVRGLNAGFTRVRINGIEGVTATGAFDINGSTNRGRGFDFSVFASELFSSDQPDPNPPKIPVEQLGSAAGLAAILYMLLTKRPPPGRVPAF